MILPIAHEDSEVRRQPWVTYGIISLCVLALAHTLLIYEDAERRVDEASERVVRYFEEHPYLGVDERFEVVSERFAPEHIEQTLRAVRTGWAASHGIEPDEFARSNEQSHLERLLQGVGEAADARPLERLGLIPSRPTFSSLFTHFFMHGGLLHIFGNMFLLFVMGSFIEDRWGRPLFAAFYLSAGLVSAGLFIGMHPDLEVPLVGASGAVAGAMGAFLVLFFRTRMRFFYWFGIFAGTFWAPAWLMLLLWFGHELLSARLLQDSMGDGGVAHWAHVGGFGFGVASALTMRFFRIEEKFIHNAIESQVTFAANPLVEEALQARQEGRESEALELLQQEFRRNPGNRDAALVLWDTAVALERASEAAPALLSVIAAELRDENPDAAVEHWDDLRHVLEPAPMTARLALHLAPVLVQRRRGSQALDVLQHALASPPESLPVPLLMRLARCAGPRNASHALGAIARALDTAIPPTERAALEALRSELGANIQAERPELRPLAVRTATPLLFDGLALRLEVEGQGKGNLPFSSVEALAVGAVSGLSDRPVLVVDLIVSGWSQEAGSLKGIRLLGNRFDPRRLVPGESDPMKALRAFLARLLDESGALPLPDPAGARGLPFRSFPDLARYEAEVLGALRKDPTPRPS